MEGAPNRCCHRTRARPYLRRDRFFGRPVGAWWPMPVADPSRHPSPSALACPNGSSGSSLERSAARRAGRTSGDKMMTLVASALGPAEIASRRRRCAARRRDQAMRARFHSKAPSTLGTFLRSFRWGHVRQLDRVSPHSQLLASASGRPVPDPATHQGSPSRRSDSTICETYGLAKEGARHHGYTGARWLVTRCWPSPVPAACCWPGPRAGGPTPSRGAAHFLRETVGRVRYCGAPGANSRCGPTATVYHPRRHTGVCRRSMDVRLLHVDHPHARSPCGIVIEAPAPVPLPLGPL